MKVFVSWSGELSHKIAIALRDWLSLTIQPLKPYVSSEDIAKGSRWGTELDNELSAARFGIVCLTPENLVAPWIHFEAGAISKIVENASGALSPFLFKVKVSDVPWPLAQFQSVRNEKDDIFKLMASINSRVDLALQLDAEKLKVTFDRWWPLLEEKLQEIADERPDGQVSEKKTRDTSEVLEELVELIRTQQRMFVVKDELTSIISELRKELLPIFTQPTYEEWLRRGGFVITGQNFTGRTGLENLAGVSHLRMDEPPTNEVAARTPEASESSPKEPSGSTDDIKSHQGK